MPILMSVFFQSVLMLMFWLSLDWTITIRWVFLHNCSNLSTHSTIWFVLERSIITLENSGTNSYSWKHFSVKITYFRFVRISPHSIETPNSFSNENLFWVFSSRLTRPLGIMMNWKNNTCIIMVQEFFVHSTHHTVHLDLYTWIRLNHFFQPYTINIEMIIYL